MERLKVFMFQEGNAKGKSNDDYSVWLMEGRSFAVADGVSRTCSSEHTSSRIAARIFCEVTTRALAEKKSMSESFVLANKEIETLNRKLSITSETVDYLGRDYLCCVGIAGVLNETPPYRFSYGCIGDCSVLVYDAHLMPKFLSENPIGVLEGFREGREFSDKNKKMVFWRRDLRNNPSQSFMTYGALTGEPSAMAYLKTGSIDLAWGNVVLLFSDGIYPFIFDVGFRAEIVSLLLNASDEATKHLRLQKYFEEAGERLRSRGVQNLDDDRTLIALMPGSFVKG